MPWYDKKWVIILFLVILWPVGLLMMWRAPTFSTKTKGLVTVFFVLIFFAAGSNKTPTKTTTQSPSTATTTEQTNKSPADEAKVKETIQAVNQTKSETSNQPIQDLPQTFNATPSIGATRAEFEKYHRKNASNASFDNYDNDEYLVTYSKANGKDERIFVLTIQGVAGKTYNLNQFIPSDCEGVEITEDYKDNMMISKVFKGHSAELKRVFPEYNGEFGYGFVLDAKTNSFISATFTAFP